MRSNDSQPELNAPPKLLAALHRSSRKPVFVPGFVDEKILTASRRHLEATRQSWFALPRLLMATATVVIAVGLPWWLVNTFQGSPSRLAGDVNQDGRVDILDAFALARCLNSNPSACNKHDINGDGIIDQRDVDVLAARAVRLEKQSGS